MDLKKLLQTTPESLAQEQYDALREAAVQRLGVLQGYVQRGQLAEAAKLLFNSPAGDCMGCDNACIDFSDLLDRGEQGCSTDIGDVIDRLAKLQEILTRTERVIKASQLGRTK